MAQLSFLTLEEQAPENVGSTDIVKCLVDFEEFGRKTDVLVRNGTKYYVNEYWTAGQRKGHSIHEISYRACFKPQLPEFFIKRLTCIGDVVHDPFMGRGTTPIEAAILKRQPSGNDINPLSVLLTRPRLKSIATAKVSEVLQSICFEGGDVQNEELLAFYHPRTLADLEMLRCWIEDLAPLDDANPDPIVDWIRMVAINRLSGHSPGFFSGRSMPPNQAVSIKAQLKINEKLGVSPPPRDVKKIILKKTNTLLRDGSLDSVDTALLSVGPAWETKHLASSSVQLVVTSPPFLDIVQYASDNWLRCWFAGIDANSVEIAMHRTTEAWTEMIHSVLVEQARILKTGGYVAFEVGEVRNKSIFLEELVTVAASGLPFDILGVMVNEQDFTKTANCWGVENGKKGTNTNRIVILRRH